VYRTSIQCVIKSWPAVCSLCGRTYCRTRELANSETCE